jgi:hypothetical protein
MTAPEPPPTEPPSKEELMARLQDLQVKATALRDRANAQAKAQRTGPKWGVIAIVFGVPLVATIAAYKALDSVLLGIVVGFVAFIAVVAVMLKITPKTPSLTPGTAAWEAKMNAGLLETVIAQRVSERDRETDDGKRAKKDRELAFLKEQLAQAHATWASEDASPGRGYVGFKPYDGE